MRTTEQELADLIRVFVGDMRAILRKHDEQTRAEIDRLKSDLARLTAKLQGVRDQVADVSEELPTVDAIAGRGGEHVRVNEDIQGSVARLFPGADNPLPSTPAGRLAILLDHLRQESKAREPMEEFPEPRRVEA